MSKFYISRESLESIAEKMTEMMGISPPISLSDGDEVLLDSVQEALELIEPEDNIDAETQALVDNTANEEMEIVVGDEPVAAPPKRTRRKPAAAKPDPEPVEDTKAEEPDPKPVEKPKQRKRKGSNKKTTPAKEVVEDAPAVKPETVTPQKAPTETKFMYDVLFTAVANLWGKIDVNVRVSNMETLEFERLLGSIKAVKGENMYVLMNAYNELLSDVTFIYLEFDSTVDNHAVISIEIL